MARASPRAVATFSANTDTSVKNVMVRSTASVPVIASPPTRMGSAAATSPPNTHTSTRKLSGIAMDSMTSRSCSVWVLIWE